MLYQVTAGDIVFFKQQQWMVMNYAVGLDAAFVFLAPSAWTTTITLYTLVVLACAVPVVAFLMLGRLRESIKVRRARLNQTRAELGDAFHRAWSVPKEPDDFYWVFTGVLAASWAVTLWLVLTRPAT